jgi:hypothetical protein
MPVGFTPLSAFLPIVLPNVPSCPDILAVAQLRLAAIEFCERTKCWRSITSTVLASNGQALITPTFATIHLIEEATLDGKPLEATQFTDIGPDELRQSPSVGVPRYITQIEAGLVQVYPFAAGGTLRVSAFLKPRSDAAYNQDANDPLHDANAYVPDFLFMQDAEAISHGAIGRIMAIPEHRFSNDQKAAMYFQSFNNACNSRFARHVTGQQRAPLRVKSRWF